MVITIVRRLLAAMAAIWFFLSDLITLGGVKVEIPKQQKDSVRSVYDVKSDTWAAVDGLGRVLPMNDETGGERERFVGLFYWTWHVGQASWAGRVVNVNEVLEQDPGAAQDLWNPAWKEFGKPNHWNRPLFGYYKTDDRWVLRRHAELLAAAGVDVIVFDNTNGTATWKDSYDVLLDVFTEARRDGVNTPRIAFLLPFYSKEDTKTQLRALYEDIYRPGRCADLWFYWKGKPLIMAAPEGLRGSKEKEDKEILSFFTFRPGIAEYNISSDDKRGGTLAEQAFHRNVYWSWLSVYPQAVNRTPDGKAEQMAVSVAQNWSAERGLTAMNGENVFGRTYTSRGYDVSENAVLYGANFAEQAARALETDPEFVYITGWNEWVAGRYEEWCGVPNAFPDEFNDCYSRDIEPSSGKLKDHYYYQMADFIRRYKGARADTPDTARLTVTKAEDWARAAKTYLSYPNNTFDRSCTGYGDTLYTDATGRNDIIKAQAASDRENLYFAVTCKEDITPADGRGMRLLLRVNGADTGWEGYTHIVNRLAPENGKTAVESADGTRWEWRNAGAAAVNVQGPLLWVKIPKATLGITDEAFTVDFKWTDNTLETGEITDLYTHGDTAPTGRFNYRYSFSPNK